MVVQMISPNVSAFTNPHWLKLPTDLAQRSVRRVEDLASAGLSAESHSLTILPADQGANAPMRECGVIRSDLLPRDTLIALHYSSLSLLH